MQMVFREAIGMAMKDRMKQTGLMEEVRKMDRKEEGEGGAKLEFGDLECALLFWGNRQRKREASAWTGCSSLVSQAFVHFTPEI